MPGDGIPALTGIIETALYVRDPFASADFYSRVFGCTRLLEEDRLVALAVAPGQVLLLFRLQGTLEPLTTPGGIIPAHDGSGRLHFALGIPPAAVGAWRERLSRLGIPIESEVEGPFGGLSLYFRDPDDHLVELATPGLWTVY